MPAGCFKPFGLQQERPAEVASLPSVSLEPLPLPSCEPLRSRECPGRPCTRTMRCSCGILCLDLLFSRPAPASPCRTAPPPYGPALIGIATCATCATPSTHAAASTVDLSITASLHTTPVRPVRPLGRIDILCVSPCSPLHVNVHAHRPGPRAGLAARQRPAKFGGACSPAEAVCAAGDLCPLALCLPA